MRGLQMLPGLVGLLLPCFVTLPGLAAEPQDYETGGPLAGVKLPPFPTQHGEEPGYPGCSPVLMAQGETAEDMGNEYREWGPQGQAPEWELYDGSVEHWRAYMFKYMPVRSFFDRQSHVKNFVAPELPGAKPSQVEAYAAPVYYVPRHDQPKPTGERLAPVPVVRMKVDAPVLKFDLGQLDEGLYALRVIGAVETEKLRPFRQPLFIRMAVNDGPSGEISQYRLRLGYCDEFYSVAEFYFHAPIRRSYRAELAVDHGSAVELLVHNVTLDDALAGTTRRTVKRRTTIAGASPMAKAALAQRKAQGQDVAEPLSKEDRLKRDAVLWRSFPRVNTQGSELQPRKSGYGSVPGVNVGTDKLDAQKIVEQYGEWRPARLDAPVDWAADVAPENIFLVNEKLKIVYSVDDAREGRPLPDPYPLQDDGAGLYFPDPKAPDRGAAWTPIGCCVRDIRRAYYQGVGRNLEQYKKRGDDDAAHEAAVMLVRFAYAFPALDASEDLHNTVHDPGAFNRDLSCRRRQTMAAFLPHYPMYVKPIMFWYDELFDFIRGSQELAESVGRFVPWVKSPEDVLRLIDVYLVQTTAKRIMRYHYHTDVVDIANLAAVAGDRQVTDPWMEWLFARTFVYPLPVAGVQDVMISGCTREGTEFVGSTYYAQGEGALRVARSLDLYLSAGGNPRFDLSDRRLYSKPAAHAWWRLENVVAGWDFLRIGDVCGPDKVPGHTLRDLDFAQQGWKWTRDPAFAFILKHYLEPDGDAEARPSEIETAAARQPRAPWLENRSRVLPMWAGVLEAGTEHDDYRFRRAAYLRLGYGMGHHHHDSLDLQVFAHGLPMTVDAGQRPGYSKPGDRSTIMHNLVEVEGVAAYRHSWATALADCPGARYLSANAALPAGMDTFRRQVALIDVDEGEGSEPLPTELQRPGSELPAGVTTPNGYVFDVFRTGGGRRHTYCFHGPINDDFQWNASRVAPPAQGSDDAQYLRGFSLMPELTLAGDAPETLEATWRMAIEIEGPGGGEKEMLGKNFVPDAPRKFTRLHLLGLDGARALRGEHVSRQWGYHFTNLMVRTPAAQRSRQSAFVALIEPYVGKPVIGARRLLAVEPNEADAQRAVAVEVRTGNGHTDILFADGRPDRSRAVPGAHLALTGEFAFYSTDGAGLRQATLVGGRRLATPLVRIEPAVPERRARVIRVDYLERKLWLDAAWTTRRTPSIVEIGIPGHRTTYTAELIETERGGACLTLRRGADYFRSAIIELTPEERTVTTALKPLIDYIDHNRAGWCASDDAMKTFYSATYLDGNKFHLAGPPVTDESFAPARVLRLWEYGVDDEVRQSTAVSLRRSEPGIYEVLADVDVVLALPGRSAAMSTDGETWRPAETSQANGWLTLHIPASEGERWLRVGR